MSTSTPPGPSRPGPTQPAPTGTDRMTERLIEVPPGLAGVVAADTRIGEVRGLEGFYHYRQYSAVELATRRSFEDVWHLLVLGELPDAAAGRAFAARVRAARAIPPRTAAALPAIAACASTGRTDPLAGLRAALTLAAGELGIGPLYDVDDGQRREHAIRVAALVPTLLAALLRLGRGEPPLEPRDDLDHTANWLYLVTGLVPDERARAAVQSYLISTIDHGFNASTFTARVVASTGADLAAAVVGGLASLSGPLHGGAPSRALDTVDAIGTVDRIEPWVREQLAAGRRMMGFGHPVYRTDDPRSTLLRDLAAGFGGPRYALATAVEEGVLRVLEEVKPGRGLRTNVEFYAGLVMEFCGLPREAFTPTFAVARVVGWTAHVLEQAAAGKIIRPSSRYVGPPAPQPVPER
ncbi:citrate synthase [Friedmanniella endophytica]|uniref:Citrate synthase n=1 Tax=Microlunatus kandeliicorticis TaxID=1759536 RepID=A0A7W3IQ31_9ACTN|nr:citrate synthase [Microlunatus kandeliicorticis]MBA8793135.1 citrate synthase [Microlunatus kandeliicorticis]